MRKRVAITGFYALSPLGATWQEIKPKVQKGETAIICHDEWKENKGLNSYLSAPITYFKGEDVLSRKQRRSMGRVAELATYSAIQALEHAGLEANIYQSGDVGIAYGSSFGSPDPLTGLLSFVQDKTMAGITSTSYLKTMSQTTAVNIGVCLGVKGRIIPTSSACTSSSHAIGYAYETIQAGKQIAMIAGGAEEEHPLYTAIFDTLFATSSKNDTPQKTPSPYDAARDGLVVGEGAGTMILEDWEHAQKRGAKIYGEILGFATNSDGVHATKPTQETMEVVMHQALKDANISASDIHFVSGHGTATIQGDIAETQATRHVFGYDIPIHSMKGYFGHTLGAAGILEAIYGLEMLRDGWICGNVNLENIDPACGELFYIPLEGMEAKGQIFMSNNFAFGGINTSLIIRSY